MNKEKMDKYKFRRYDRNFALLYKKELARLKRILPMHADIEHIGSTAVMGLRGKGLIDIVIAVPKRSVNSAKKLLEKGGYEFRPNAGDKERIFLRRDYLSKGRERSVHLHLTHRNSKTFIEMVALRDYLISHKEEIRRY